MKLILGSTSKTRQQILKKLGYKFKVITANIDEKKIRSKNPKDLVLKLAYAKTEAIKKIAPLNGVLITSDQITYANGKAKNLKEAEKFLSGYSSKTCENITGIIATNLRTGKQASGVDITKITLKKLDLKIIKKALADPNVLSYCGAAVFGQEIWQPYIEKITGDKTALFGISVKLMEKLIKKVDRIIKPTKPIITLCSSASFYRDVLKIERELKKLGFSVKIPKTANWMKRQRNFDPVSYKTWMQNPKDFKIKNRLIDDHFKKILASDAILVVNQEKRGLNGYIGGNVLMEMTIAYLHQKPIFILNSVSKKIAIYEEVLGLEPIFIDGDLEKIKI